MSVCVDMLVEVRGQLQEVISLLHVGPGDQIQVVRLGGRCFTLKIKSRQPLGVSKTFWGLYVIMS